MPIEHYEEKMHFLCAFPLSLTYVNMERDFSVGKKALIVITWHFVFALQLPFVSSMEIKSWLWISGLIF